MMLLISYLLKRKEKNFLLNFAIHRHDERGRYIWYQIRFDPRLGIHYGCFKYCRRVGCFTFDLRFYCHWGVLVCVLKGFNELRFPFVFGGVLPLRIGTIMSCVFFIVFSVFATV